MATTLTIDGEGNEIRGPRIGMVSYLATAGAVRLDQRPRRFPPRAGQQLVCVKIGEPLERRQSDVAIWVTDQEGFDLLKAWAGLKVWLEIPNEPLLTARREAIELQVDGRLGDRSVALLEPL